MFFNIKQTAQTASLLAALYKKREKTLKAFPLFRHFLVKLCSAMPRNRRQAVPIGKKSGKISKPYKKACID